MLPAYLLMVILVLDSILIGPPGWVPSLRPSPNPHLQNLQSHVIRAEEAFNLEERQVFLTPRVLGDYVRLCLRLVCASNPRKPLANATVLISIYNITYTTLGSVKGICFVVERDFPLLVTEGVTNEQGWLNITLWAPLWKERLAGGLWVYPGTYYNLTIILVKRVGASEIYYMIYNTTFDGEALSLRINGSMLPCELTPLRFRIMIKDGRPLRDALVRIEQRINKTSWVQIWSSLTNYTGYTGEFLAPKFHALVDYVLGKRLHILEIHELVGKWSFRVSVLWRGVKVFEKRIPITELAIDCPLSL